MGKSCGKILQENLAGKSYGKILWEMLVGNACGKILWENLAKNVPKIANVGVFAIFRPLTGKTLQKHFYLVEKVLSFDLVGHM